MPQSIGITIDDVLSRDLDDAIWLEEHKDGWRYILTVSIADIASVISKGSRDDQKAARQGFTRYFRDGNKSMLPRELSDEKLSLLPNGVKDVYAVIIPIGEDLSYGAVRIKRTQGESKARLHYKEVQEILADTKHDLYSVLNALLILARGLGRKRSESGALVAYDAKMGWVTNEEGNLVHLESPHALNAYVIVQECMILTNRMVAEYLAERGIHALYRNHVASAIAPERSVLLEDLRGVAHDALAFKAEITQQRLSLIMGRAMYSPRVQGHFALNLPVYCHFTSPIRRYSDLINQRIVVAALEGRENPYALEELEAIAGYLNELTDKERERRKKGFTEHKRKEAEKNIDGSELSVLGAVDFHRIIKYICESPAAITDAVQEAIIERLHADTLPDRDITLLLFAVRLLEDDGWGELHKALCRHIAQHLPLGPTILSMACQTASFLMAEFGYTDHGVVNERFFFSAKIIRHGVHYVSRVYSAPNKKHSQQIAALNLIRTIVGVDTDLDGSELGGMREPKQEAATLVAQDGVAISENYKGRLMELCQKYKWSPPVYTLHTQEGPPNKAIFGMVGSVVCGTKTFNSRVQRAHKKQAAEQLAAGDLLSYVQDYIRGMPTVALVAEVSPGTTCRAPEPPVENYKGRLIEFCQQYSLGKPDYKYEHTGSSHAPIFIAHGIVEMLGNTYQSDPGISTTKKGAEHYAAKSLLEKLKESMPSLPRKEREDAAGVQDGDYVSALNRMCQKHQLGAPRYMMKATGAAGNIRQRCTCSLKLAGANTVVITRTAKGATTSDAEREAARLVFDSLVQLLKEKSIR